MGNIVGVSEDILMDPRVQAAITKNEQGIDVEAAQVITSNPTERLAKLGIKLRISGLNHKALIARIMYACPSSLKPKKSEDGLVIMDIDGKPTLENTPDIPGITQALIWLYTLAAPMGDVYSAVSSVENSGLDEFIEKVDVWFEKKNIQGDALQEIITANTEDMLLSAKLQMPSNDPGTGEIKNV